MAKRAYDPAATGLPPDTSVHRDGLVKNWPVASAASASGSGSMRPIAANVAPASTHPARRYQPTLASPLDLQLSELARRQGEVAPVEKRLLDLKAEQQKVKARYDAARANWETKRGVLADLERDSFDLTQLIGVVDAELERRLSLVVEVSGAIDATLRAVNEHLQVCAEFTVKSNRPLPVGYSIDRCNGIVRDARAKVAALIGHGGENLNLALGGA